VTKREASLKLRLIARALLRETEEGTAAYALAIQVAEVGFRLDGRRINDPDVIVAERRL
jgi:hypothetical protein